MKSKIIYFGSSLLVLIWIIGFWGYHISGVIHILPAIAVFSTMLRLLYNKSFIRSRNN